MSYERHNSMTRLEQYRARQIARIEALHCAIEEGRTSVVHSNDPVENDDIKHHAEMAVTEISSDNRYVSNSVVDLLLYRYSSELNIKAFQKSDYYKPLLHGTGHGEKLHIQDYLPVAKSHTAGFLDGLMAARRMEVYAVGALPYWGKSIKQSFTSDGQTLYGSAAVLHAAKLVESKYRIIADSYFGIAPSCNYSADYQTALKNYIINRNTLEQTEESLEFKYDMTRAISNYLK